MIYSSMFQAELQAKPHRCFNCGKLKPTAVVYPLYHNDKYSLVVYRCSSCGWKSEAFKVELDDE